MINLLSSFSPASDVTVIVKVVGFSDSTVQRKKASQGESLNQLLLHISETEHLKRLIKKVSS